MKNQITLTKREKKKTTQRATPAELLLTQNVAKEKIQTVPEVELLRTIPGIDPFISSSEFIPDLVYIYQLEGITSVLQQLFGTNEPLVRQVLDIYQKSSIEETAKYISELTRNQVEPGVIMQYINRDGINKLASYVAAADPLRPSSLIEQHSSQNIFKNIQKVEIELIKNEPDVIERPDIKCPGCKQNKVRTTPVQLRSADEASDYLAACASCHRHWIIRS